ncbi:MAG: ubiquinol-cytochrome c reductase iron-sulfur subunit [Gammaproteobacteria bacterium]|nr:ubiquinol-cytochrome c reductase iron-sulfur subunit [Gammaproteobacteria bacterium]
MAHDCDQYDASRRAFLKMLSQLIGTVSVVLLGIPFLAAWLPSAKTRDQGAPIEVDLSALPPGGLMTVAWRGKPVWILRRTQEEIDSLSNDNPMLSDPASLASEQPEKMRNIYRSIRPDILVLIGLCTHLGCIPTYKPEKGAINPKWPGGFYCPCHGSMYDLAGRVFKGVPAPSNLAVPPYLFLSADRILIGRE